MTARTTSRRAAGVSGRLACTTIATLAVTSFVLAACSDGDTTPDAVTEATDATTEQASTGTPDDTSTSTPSDNTDEQTTSSGTSAPEPAESETGEPTSAYPWLPELALLTEPSDDLRPLLAWEPVEDATTYSVTVTAPTGVAYWAWQTDATSIHLGGEPRLDDEQSGPATVPGMTWSVLAFDVDGRPIAASVEAILRP